MILGVAMDPEIRDCSSETHWKKTFSDLDYSLIGYDILFGYPLANGRDPGFRQPIFTANYSKPKQTADCRHVMSSGDFLLIISQAVCQNYYSVIDFTNPPPFDPGFISKAETLADPESGDEAVLEFIKYYGTHFMTQATYGAKFVQHHKVSQTTFESLKRSEFSVEAQANYAGLISIGGGISLDSDQKNAASNFLKQVQTTTYTVGSTPPSNGDAMTWAASVKQNPVPMQYTLSPIDLLFTEPFVKELPPGFDYTAVRQKLKNSSQLYCQALKQQGMVHSCEDYFQLETQGVDIYEPGTALILTTCSINKHLMTNPLGNSKFCFPRVSMFPESKPGETLSFEGNKITCFLRDQPLSDLLYIGSWKFIKPRCNGGRRSTS